MTRSTARIVQATLICCLITACTTLKGGQGNRATGAATVEVGSTGADSQQPEVTGSAVTATSQPQPTDRPIVPATPTTIDSTPLPERLKEITSLNVREIRLLARLSSPDRSVPAISIAFSPDAGLLAIAQGQAAQVWDLRSGQRAAYVSAEFAQLHDLVFSPDGHLLAGVSANEVFFWTVADGRLVRRFNAGGDFLEDVFGLAFSPDGGLLATSSFFAGNGIRLWDVQTGELVSEQFSGSGGEYDVAFHPSGMLLISAGRDGVVRQWHPTTGQRMGQIEACIMDAVDIAFSPAGGLLAINCTSNEGWDNGLKLYDTGTWQRVDVIGDDKAPKAGFSFNGDGSMLAVGIQLGEVRAGPTLIDFWDIESGEQLYSLQADVPNLGYPLFSPDGRLLAVAEVDGTVQLFGIAAP